MRSRCLRSAGEWTATLRGTHAYGPTGERAEVESVARPSPLDHHPARRTVAMLSLTPRAETKGIPRAGYLRVNDPIPEVEMAPRTLWVCAPAAPRAPALGPNTTRIDDLFKRVVGLNEISASWRWRGMKATGARAALDRLLTLRHEIAHRVHVGTAVTEKDVSKAMNLILRLAEASTREVNRHTTRP